MNKHFQRALVLVGQGRFDLAEPEVRRALAQEPDDAFLHAMLAECLLQREQLKEATAEAGRAVHLDPEDARGHAVLARALLARNRPDEAEGAIEEALRLEPEDADYHALLAAIRLDRRDWEGALGAAERGLGLDPENVMCNNLRAMALVSLGRQDEAGATLEAALARDPEDALSHANMGWACLHRGDRQKALEHFREALRLDPELDHARAGIVEALKAKNVVYALMLRYFLWMGRLSGGAAWLIVLGGYFGYRVLSDLARNNPELAPWVWPVLALYLVFVVMTWLAMPLFNLLLRLDRFGRHALSREQVVASNWVGGLLVPALASLGTWLVTGHGLALWGAVYFGLLLLPVSAVFACQRGWPRWLMIAYTAALAAVGLAYPWLVLVDRDLAGAALGLFLLGGFLSTFAGNLLGMASPRR